MRAAASGVLKGSRVRLAGAQPIGEASPSSPEGAVTARIVERSGGQALVEIVCECGRTIHLHCTCGGAAGEGAPEPHQDTNP